MLSQGAWVPRTDRRDDLGREVISPAGGCGRTVAMRQTVERSPGESVSRAHGIDRLDRKTWNVRDRARLDHVAAIG